MGEVIAYLIVCFVAGVGVAKHSGLIVGVCIAAAWIIGRAHG